MLKILELKLSLRLDGSKPCAYILHNRSSHSHSIVFSPLPVYLWVSWSWHFLLSYNTKGTNLASLFMSTKHQLYSQTDTWLFAKVMALICIFFQSSCIWTADDEKEESGNFEADFGVALYNYPEEVLEWITNFPDCIYWFLDGYVIYPWHCTSMALSFQWPQNIGMIHHALGIEKTFIFQKLKPLLAWMFSYFLPTFIQSLFLSKCLS